MDGPTNNENASELSSKSPERKKRLEAIAAEYRRALQAEYQASQKITEIESRAASMGITDRELTGEAARQQLNENL